MTIGATFLGVIFSGLQILFKKLQRWWVLKKKAVKTQLTNETVKNELTLKKNNEKDNVVRKN
jgi:hypothetical protein